MVNQFKSSALRPPALSYSLPALPLAAMAISFYVFVPKFYADLGTVSVQSIGIALLLSRLWDAFTDPTIGALSDRTVSTHGRRKPWLLFSLPLLAFSFALLFIAPWLPERSHYVWFFVVSVLFFLFWTMFSVPYEAIGQELTSDYDQRTRLFSFRDGAIVVGTLVAAIVPTVAESQFKETKEAIVWLWIAAFYIVLLTASTIWLFRRVGNGADRVVKSVSVRKSLSSTLRNPHFRLLLIAYIVAAFGAALPATLFLFYTEHVLRSEAGPAMLALYFLIGVVVLPLWNRLATIWDKKRCWLLALLINTGGFVGVYFIEPGDTVLYLILISISALGYGASLTFPSSMQADVIDSEELSTGLRKEGEFLGVWSLAKKTSAALGAGAALWILGESGFDATLELQSPSALQALRILYCLVPCVCSFAAIVILTRYSLNRAEHEAIRMKLQNV